MDAWDEESKSKWKIKLIGKVTLCQEIYESWFDL